MRKQLLRDLADSLTGRTVLLRLDLNVPIDAGRVSDDTRIEAALPTLRLLRDIGARTVVLSHLGRPKGQPDGAFTLAPVAARVAALLGSPVGFVPHSVGPGVDDAVRAMRDGDVVVLENTRFEAGETGNDPVLGQQWASLADVYVNDAFGTAHRAHASTDAAPRAVRAAGGVAVAGPLMERELDFLSRVTHGPEAPFVAILGGAKISGKIDVVEALLSQVDRLLIGGAMANTFFLALGLDVGNSLTEPDRVEVARALLERGGDRIVLPIDARVADRIAPDASCRSCARADVGPGESIGDIGPDTEVLFAEIIRGARTVLWNGPMGVFEMAPFSGGTLAVARAVADATERGALTVIGGGDSAAAAEVAGVAGLVSHVSTGGGASLEYLAGTSLPGVDALSDPREGVQE